VRHIAHYKDAALAWICRKNQYLAFSSGGWWSIATRREAHRDHVGGAIAPFAVVVHTTDMTPESFDGLVHRWGTEVGEGNGAHFIIGRSEVQGVIQLVPINRNANHAGGEQSGSFVAGTQHWQPNHVAVGIELHCAGGLRQHDGRWRLFEKGVPTGAAI
jgi:N-acetylmuramoyl-L-alanine amidase CwlA